MEGICALLAPLVGDDRVGPVHVCLYLAVLQCGERQAMAAPFFIRREELMELAKIRGKTTYFRVMREMVEFGYIEYWPSRDKGGRCRVSLVEITSSKFF